MALAEIVRFLIALFIGCVVSIFPLYLVVKTAIRHPFTAFSKKKRVTQPDVLNDPSLGIHGYIHLEVKSVRLYTFPIVIVGSTQPNRFLLSIGLTFVWSTTNL